MSAIRSSTGRSAPRLDVGVALFQATGVLLADDAPGRRLQHPGRAVGIASDVGEDVAAGPAGQE